MPMWLVLVGGIALGGIGLWLIFKKNNRPGWGFFVGCIGAFLIILFFMNEFWIPKEGPKPNQKTSQIQEGNSK